MDSIEPQDALNPQIPPPPPPPAPHPMPTPAPALDPWAVAPLRPGQFSPGWKLAFIAGWIGVLAGFGAIWQASRIAGIAPWWLGPESDQRSFVVIAIPFIVPMLVVIAAMLGLRLVCWFGILAGLLTAAVALGDLHFPGIAVVETILGICGIMISIASFGGRMRKPPTLDPLEQPTPLRSEIGATQRAARCDVRPR